ncbi:poly(A)-specific ribonuclease PARN-like [Galendromus occidentalis]|uniref:Poly(A)-specific ribonuclease PARN-like n=1 Tax=Galendromus occidentalis TaxID=34638 RepID=A0AAJ7L4X6_9ACAR|nr:poly(A)-specific ribonuclease PARN-like [Galendromus occidentalis]
MDVTKSNFNDLKPQIEEAIEKCSFAAIDCEFTGLVLPEPLHPLDTVAQRYQKLRVGISEYLVVQFGLSLWTFDEEKQAYNVKTFNIFTYPDQRQAFRFRNQASCLSFLVDHGFDLNRCVREGVPFLRPAELDDYQERIKRRHIRELASLFEQEQAGRPVKGFNTSADALNSSLTSDNFLDMDPAVRIYLEGVMPLVSKWMSGKMPDQDSVLLPACNDFIRMTVYRQIEKKFPDDKFQMEAVRADNGADQRGSKHIKISRSDMSPHQRMSQRHRDEMEALRDSFGVGSVLKTLVTSQKPVVGHNSLRDILHVIHQFVAPLPEDFGEFQLLCRELFPVLFDTKQMSVTGTIKASIRGSRLVDVFNQIKNQHDKAFPIPKIHSEPGFAYDDMTREHEAGFDAWLTGYIFAAFAHSVAPRPKNVFREPDFRSEYFKPFVNKMHFGPSLDISVMDLDVNPAAVSRTDVYVVEWKEPEDHSHARLLLQMAGGAKKCGWGDQVLAFVPSNVENCNKLLRTQDSAAIPCRLYKHQTKQNRRRKAKSKSPPNTAPVPVQNAAPTSGAVPPAAPAATSRSPPTVAILSRGDDYSPQARTNRSSSLTGTSEPPKKPKLDSISEKRKTTPPSSQQPFPEASW